MNAVHCFFIIKKADVTRMAKYNSESNTLDSEQRITLDLLTAIHNSDRISQRFIANELSIALGLANTYLKRCIKKGFIKVKQAPANRYAYYLTPKGFLEKTHLTAEYLSQSLGLFRVTRDEANTIYSCCQKNKWRRVVVMGEGDLVDIFVMSVPTKEIKLYHFSKNSAIAKNSHEGLLTIPEGKLQSFDAVIICDMKNPIYYYRLARSILPTERVFAPKFLGIDKKPVIGKDR